MAVQEPSSTASLQQEIYRDIYSGIKGYTGNMSEFTRIGERYAEARRNSENRVFRVRGFVAQDAELPSPRSSSWVSQARLDLDLDTSVQLTTLSYGKNNAHRTPEPC